MSTSSDIEVFDQLLYMGLFLLVKYVFQPTSLFSTSSWSYIIKLLRLFDMKNYKLDCSAKKQVFWENQIACMVFSVQSVCCAHHGVMAVRLI